jgi:hypothetical protein
MEARLVDALLDDAGWQFEPKWDGFRCLAFRAGDEVDIRAKSGKSLARFFPDVVAMLQGVPAERTPPRATTVLFRRCCAMCNFFAVEANRLLVGVEDEGQPEPPVWAAAATAPVHRVLNAGLACDTFDPREFAAVRGKGN